MSINLSVFSRIRSGSWRPVLDFFAYVDSRRLLKCLIFFLASFITLVPAAHAKPFNGFGFYAGVIGAKEADLNSSGLSLGVDAQFVINEFWSLNPILMISSEHESANRNISDNFAGLQLRRWMENWFVGGQLFYHARAIIIDGTVSQTNYAPGIGLLGGYESDSGWGAEIQIDAFEMSNVKGEFRNAIRLNLTHRWR